MEKIEEIAKYLQWALSCCIDETTLEDFNNNLLQPDLYKTWRKLLKGTQNQEAIERFYTAAIDSCSRYENVGYTYSNEQRNRYAQIEKTLEKLSRLLNESETGSHLSSEINNKLFDELEKHWNFTRKNDSHGGASPRHFYMFRASNWVDIAKEFSKKFSKHPPQHHPLLSAKRGDSGLSAFYTNSLCEITEEHFKQAHYEEIADIANIVLDIDKDSPITGENVRMNYNNLKKRKNKNRKISA